MNGSDRRDLGTPSVPSAPMVELEIDGRQVKTPAGTSILRAAGEHGVMIPKLCATEHLKAFGSCRLCLVEVEGRRGYPASCTTPVEAGMKVRTQSDALRELRRKVMELYISDHPLDCLTCAANGACELQTMAGVVGLREVRYGDGRPGALANHYLEARRDASNPYFQFDPGKCIVCSRCVRSCEEQQGSFAISIAGRGFDAKVNAGQNEAFLASECVSCGACVAACPTAALVEKTVLEAGQPSGSIDTTCAYCGVGCMLHVQTQGERVVRVRPAKEGRANEGHACVKGRFAWGYATHAERITRPMLRENINDPWREVSWDEAIARVAGEFKRIQQTHGQSAIGAIVSSRCTNEEDYLVQKLVRAAFGNNNVDNCARVCHSPTGYGLKQTLGESAGTQAFASVAQADLFLLIGANP
ncbi:MAG: molybdopterin-dependent oxidoreductase, partial [Burkholderiales bacterium]